MNEPSLQQRRAAHALREVEELKERGENAKYVSYVKGLPAAILLNGLGQSLATLLAAAKGNSSDPNRILFNQLERWLRDDEDAPYHSTKGLMEAITGQDEATYCRAQAEAIAYLTWLKKFAVAYLGEKKQEG